MMMQRTLKKECNSALSQDDVDIGLGVCGLAKPPIQKKHHLQAVDQDQSPS
jgi:hypothetical protein